MNKKLLTIAIGTALGMSPLLSAQADVTVFGRVQAEIAQYQNDGAQALSPAGNGAAVGSVPAQTDQTLMNDAIQGRFGIAVDEDLGGGLKAIGMLEFVTDTTDGGAGTAGSVAPISSRHAYVGLSHKAAGTLRFGRIDGPYKTTGAGLDPYIATNLEARNNFGMSGNADGYGVLNAHGNYLSDMMQYISPSLVGLTLDLAIGVDGTGADVTTAACAIPIGATTGTSGAGFATAGVGGCGQGASTRGDLSTALSWKGGPAMVFVAYNKMSNVAPTAAVKQEPNAKKIGAQFKLGGGSMTHTINAQYEMTDRDIASGTTYGAEGKYLFLGYHLGLGKTTVSLQGGQFEDDVNTEATYYMLAARYNFSKTASTWIGYRHTEVENSLLTASTVLGSTVSLIRDENVLSLGLRKDF